MMRKLAQFLLVSCIFTFPAVAQRGGGGFHGGGMGGYHGGGFGPAYRGGFGHGFRGYGGYYGRGYGWGPGFRGRWPYYGYWPYFGVGPGYPYYNGYPYWPYSYPYAYPAYSYPAYSLPYAYSYPSDNGYAYSAPAQASCPQSNGTLLYQIKLTYQDNVWLAQDYWYTPGTLNFRTLQGEEKKTPIDSIDRQLTFHLNRACGVNFQFP